MHTLLHMAAWMAVGVCMIGLPATSAERPSVAFFYGHNPSVAELAHFEQVVVEPEAVRPETLAALREHSEVFAYLSVGEVSRSSPAHALLQRSWILARNAAWNSEVIDPLHEGVRAFLLSQAEALWARGYRGFFLDTLDSPLAVPASPAQRQARIQAMVSVLRRMHQRMPGVRLLLNRGFELFPDVAPLASGVVAESLFARWNAARRRYEPVPEQDRTWLQAQLNRVHELHGLPVTVIDYVPPAERAQARSVARKIHDLGFMPYVTNADLDMLGVGGVELVPRRILALHDGAEGGPGDSMLHQLLAVPLEALGYTLEYRDVRGELPDETLAGRYAGVVGWLSDTPLRQPEALRAWLDRRCEEGVRVVLFGSQDFLHSRSFLARWGLAPVSLEGKVQLGRRDALVGFEAPPAPRSRSVPGVQAVGAEVRVHLSVRDASGREAAAILTGPCGGLALGPYVLEEGFAGQRRWILNPFAFLAQALATEPFPAPDVTTENGRRALVIQIDGEGLGVPALLPERPLAGRILLERLLASHQLPVGLRLPERELATPGLSALVRQLERRLHLEREEEHEGLGIGGGLGRLSFDNPSLTGLTPLLRPGEGEKVHVYDPLVDAHAFVALAQPPYAYSRLMEVFEWTDNPRRLKPLALYHPVSACATPAGLVALEMLYAWVEAQPTLPLWPCEYAERVRGFAQATLARRLDGTWEVRGLGALRTLRLPAALGWPDPGRSRGVAGFMETPQGRYVSLTGPSAELVLTPEPPQGPRLVWANAPLLSWRTEPALEVRLRGHVPVSLALAGGPAGCQFTRPAGPVRGVPGDGVTIFHFPDTDTGHARLVCP